MGKLTFTDLETENSKLRMVQEALLGLFLSAGSFMCLSDLFGFSYNINKCFSGGFTGGLVKAWNLIADALGRSDYVILSQFAGESDSCGLFLTFCIIAGAAAGYVIIRQRASWGLLLFVLPALILNLAFDLKVSLYSGGMLVLAVLLAVMYIRSDGEGFLQSLVFVILTGMLVYSAFNLPVGEDFARRPEAVRQMKTGAEEHIEDMYYGTNPLKNGSLSERKREEGEGTALTVTMENPHSMYLRGFIGDIYENDVWENLPDDVYYENISSMNWLEKTGFNAAGQIGQARALTGEEPADGKVEINVKDGDRRYAYVPYEIEQPGDDFTVKGGNIIEVKGPGRNSSYSYTAGDNAVKTWTETAGRIFTEAESLEENQEKLDQYFLDESNYNRFVYSNYTYVSINDKITLKKYFDTQGDQSSGHIDYKTAINRIKSYLNDNFIYTDNLGAKPEKAADPLTEFFTSKKGYDVQYATAAALMFRYFGIPARYVEGYLITPEDAEKAEAGKPVEIGRERNHAWVEIYIDGTGFVPIEVSPEYEGVMEEADMTVGISNEALLHKPDPPESGESEAGEEGRGGDDRQHAPWKWLLLMIIPAVMILAAVLFKLAHLIMALAETSRRKKFMRTAPPKPAVCAAYEYAEDRDYPVSDRMRYIGNKAAYSRDDISEEERQEMLGELQQAEKISAERKKAEKREGKKNEEE